MTERLPLPALLSQALVAFTIELDNAFEQHGDKLLDAVRGSLQSLVEGDGEDRSPLLAGLEPPPGSWRPQVTQLQLLPHYPMPRQGGHPDGV